MFKGFPMRKAKPIVVRNAAKLAKALGLSPADGAEIELRSALNSKSIETFRLKNLTHAQVAALARTSRTRITAILNGNTKAVPTDLLLRVLLPRLHRQNHLQIRRLTEYA
jgi:hypothetical protein